MNLQDLLGVAQAYGPPGLIIGYLLWERYTRDQREDARMKREEEIREKRIEADKEMARAMTLLSERVG